MKTFILAVLSFIFIVMLPPPAQAEKGCLINALGIKVCGELVDTPLPEVVKVTIKPDPVVIPGPTVTVTKLPKPNKTITIPGPTRVITKTQKTKTRTIEPGRQMPTRSVTIEGDPVQSKQVIKTHTHEKTIIKKVFLGTLVGLVLAALGVLALFLGYYFGYRDANKDEDKFLRGLLSKIASRINR